MQSTSVTCKSCGNQFEGKYCSYCGEKVYEAHDKKFSHFFEEATHFITHFDSKFFRSFWYMFARPGFVSKEYCEGKRKMYFSPISMFLVGVVIYLLFPLLPGMNIAFFFHLKNNNTLHFHALQNWAEHKAAVEHISLEQLSERFDHLSPKFSKVLLVVLIPFSALMLALLYSRKRLYYYDHIVMAAEFNSFYLFYTFIILPLLITLLSKIIGYNLDYGDTVFFLSLQGIIILVVIALEFRTFYKVHFLIGLLKGILFIALYLVTVHVYRIVLFSMVMLFL